MNFKNKIKILHLIDTGGHGGAEQVFSSLIERIADDDYDNYIVLPDDGWLYNKLLKCKNVNLIIYSGHGRFNFKYIYFLIRFIIKNNIQVVHSHLFGTSMYASLASFICRVPVICTFHGYIDLKNNRKIEAIKYFLIGLFATKIVAVSEGLMKYLIDLSIVGKNKFCTIYNGIDILKISKHSSTYDRNIFGVSENNILIGSIGNLKEAKGYDILIKVAKVVTEKYDNCRFMIAGNIDSLVYDELLYLRKGLSLDSYVIFTGYLENVEEYLQMIDIFLLTSNSEGFSLATIEAMNAGIPVVATRCGGPQEIISHKNNGLLADVGDELSLAREIFRCIEDTNLKNILVDNAKKLVSERFNVTSMVDKYIKMYYEVINN